MEKWKKNEKADIRREKNDIQLVSIVLEKLMVPNQLISDI